MNDLFKVGNIVKLADPDTVYRYNTIPPEHWGKNWPIAECLGPWNMDQSVSKQYGPQFGYRLRIEGRTRHVISAMISPVSGPW